MIASMLSYRVQSVEKPCDQSYRLEAFRAP